MNSYQTNVAVNTVLNLDSGLDSAAVKRKLEPSSAPEPFRKVLSEQRDPRPVEPRERKPEPRRPLDRDDTNKPPVESKSRTSKTEPDETPLDASKAIEGPTEEEPKVIEGETTKKADEVPVAVVQDFGTEPADEVGETPVKSEESETTEEPPQKTASESEEVAEPTTASPLAVDVAAAAAQAPVTEGKSAVQEIDPLRAYRVNASGKPLAFTGQKSDSVVEAFDQGKDLGGNKSQLNQMVSPEGKSTTAQQFTKMIAQMSAAQPVSGATDQALKELTAKLDVKSGRESAVSPLVAAGRGSSGVAKAPGMPGGAASVLQSQIKATIGQPKWQAAISERVAFMSSQNIKSAEIQLDPPELGPLQVRVTVNQDQASVAFSSHHAQVREALDQTAFRLREMLQQEGMNQVDVDVSDQPQSQQNEQGQQSSGSEGQAGDHGEDEVQTQTVSVSTSLVDQFV